MNGIAARIAIFFAIVSWLVAAYAVLRLALDAVRENKPNALIVKALEFVPRTNGSDPSKANPFAKLFLCALLSFVFFGFLGGHLPEN